MPHLHFPMDPRFLKPPPNLPSTKILLRIPHISLGREESSRQPPLHQHGHKASCGQTICTKGILWLISGGAEEMIRWQPGARRAGMRPRDVQVEVGCGRPKCTTISYSVFVDHIWM
ncbi:hypothetical protein COCNU_14G010870 [Cocos nucifera]|uniref:Uncharacterized protein n=1 Tax=Cocos nucifera TaxID=13894 RepID=A0A8K0NCL2_COCNU|nr:hypothetical protein COCNU_14G010870 [Cocos nucifera]